MKKITFFAALMTLVMSGCTETPFNDVAPEGESTITLPDLTAGFADNTRTYVENNKYLRWHEDDRLTAFYGNTLNRQYKFKGETGDNSGTFALVPSGELGTGNAFDHIYAVYPYIETAKITDEGEISLTLPAVQYYAENSFGRGANTMIAVTENLEDTFLAFKNACGYLQLNLYGNETIKSIEIKGNNDEKIAGEATATMDFGGAPQLTMSDNATTAITIDCNEGITIGQTAETATEFWVVIPETTFANGITITVTDTDGEIFEKTTGNEIVIERNSIQPMVALGVECVWVQPKNKIYYTATAQLTPFSTSVFGANITSNEWDESTGEGVITFDGEVTNISRAFQDCDELTSISIPSSVTAVGGYAFDGCLNLKSITLPEELTEIGMYAFQECKSLETITLPNSVTTIGNYAFYVCQNLKSISLGNGVTSIGDSAFQGCQSLESIVIPDGVKYIRQETFAYCTKLSNITLPNKLTYIENEVFYKCSSLESITIPEVTSYIGIRLFWGCDKLQEIKGIYASEDGRCLIYKGALIDFAPAGVTTYRIPNNVTEIKYGAFVDRTKLTSVIIPSSVTKIGDSAFAGCSNLTSVYCLSYTPPTGGSYMFNRVGYGFKIYVPNTTYVISAYQSASGWSSYKNSIVGGN